MTDVVLLVLDHLLGRLDLRHGSIPVCLDLHVLTLDFLVLLVQLHQLLVLGFDLVPELLHLESHPFVLLLEVADLLLRPEEVLRIQVAIRSNCLVQVLLVLAFVLHLLILPLQVLDLCVLKT